MSFLQSRVFQDIQLRGIFHDSKTLSDADLRTNLHDLESSYDFEWSDEEVMTFVRKHLSLPDRRAAVHIESSSALDHVRQLWPHLSRSGDQGEESGSRLSYPHPYVVPGGRFDEMYYWDSYFTMLGLAVEGDVNLMRGMVDNFAHCIETYGFIPNGNREYFLSRSQPPFFVEMIKLLQHHEA